MIMGIFRIVTMLGHRHVIADLTRNPEGGGDTAGPTTRQHQPPNFPSPLMGEETKACPSA